MAATGVDRDSRAGNRQLQKEWGDYRVKTEEKLDSLQAGQQALQEGQKSLEAKLDEMMAILMAEESNITEERAQFEAQDSQIQPSGVPISQEETISPTNLQAPSPQEKLNSQIQPPGIPVRQGEITSAVVPANSQFRPQEIVSQQHQSLAQAHRFAPVIPPTNLHVPITQEAVTSQQQYLAQPQQFAQQMHQPPQFYRQQLLFSQQTQQFVPQFQDEPYSWCYDRAYPDPYLHPDTGDGSDYPRIQLESITRYQQQNYSHSYSAYGQFHDCGVNFSSYDGVNRLRNHNGISAGSRNLDYDRNSVGYVDVVAQEPSSIVSQTEFSSNQGKVDEACNVEEDLGADLCITKLGAENDSDLCILEVKETGIDCGIEHQHAFELENEEVNGNSSEFSEYAYGMDVKHLEDSKVDDLMCLEVVDPLNGVEDKAEVEYNELERQNKKEVSSKLASKEISNISVLSFIIIVAAVGRLEVIKGGKCCLEIYERLSLGCSFRLKEAERIRSQIESLLGILVHFSYSIVVVGWVQIVESAAQLDYKRYKKKFYARSGIVRCKVLNFQSRVYLIQLQPTVLVLNNKAVSDGKSIFNKPTVLMSNKPKKIRFQPVHNHSHGLLLEDKCSWRFLFESLRAMILKGGAVLHLLHGSFMSSKGMKWTFVSNKLELLASAQVNNVFHVCLLRKCWGVQNAGERSECRCGCNSWLAGRVISGRTIDIRTRKIEDATWEKAEESS